MDIGWDRSAAAWIASMGAAGDWGRANVLDRPMLEEALKGAPQSALDVGCGEGRFCRMLRERGVAATGIDPTGALIDEARLRDPSGDYRPGRAEALDFPDAAFDLVVSYLTLIDIEDAAKAIREMARVLRPGGALVVAHINGFTTAAEPNPWRRDIAGTLRYTFDDYLDVRATEIAWKGIRIVNWHRPLSFYFKAFLDEGLALRRFDEPEPTGGGADKIARYRRAPHFCLMGWEKA
jgi:SAM-dependent methyltransferase